MPLKVEMATQTIPIVISETRSARPELKQVIGPQARQAVARESDSESNQQSMTTSPSTCPPVPSGEFTIIWQDLTFRVDTRPWYMKTRDICIQTRSPSCETVVSTDSPQLELESGGYSRAKVIFNRICGDIKSRQLTAIMGPSGAGKSSLLNCLFQNRRIGVTGRILVDSRNRNKLKVCFIPQHDYLNEYLTVREDLIFVSKLKSANVSGLFKENSTEFLASDTATASESETYVKQSGHYRDCLIDHEANALRVAEILGLTNCLDVKIKNISGGQKKRLSIARELMSKPDILILDEPTTGLDSLTCYKSVSVLRDLVRLSENPIAVVATIHQPQRTVFNLFDKAYFLSSKGLCVYDDHPRMAVDTLRHIADVTLPSPNSNPASLLIEAASDRLPCTVLPRLVAHQRDRFYQRHEPRFLDKLSMMKAGSGWFRGSSRSSRTSGSTVSKTRAPSHLTNPRANKTSNGHEKSDHQSFHEQYFISHQLSSCLSSHSNSYMRSFYHIFILAHRSWLSMIRNHTYTRTRFAFHTLLPIFMLFVFNSSMGAPNGCPGLETELNLGQMMKNVNENALAQTYEDSRLTLENMSFFFILIYGFGINIISCTASFYPLTMRMFKKEAINGLYSPGPYFIGQMLAELPFEIFYPSISVCLAYVLSSQASSFLEWRMFAVSYTVFLVCYSIHALGLLCGSIMVNNISVAVLLGQACLLPFVMFSGMLVRAERMPDWMLKLSYLSPFKHAINAIALSRYGFNICECTDDLIPQNGTIAMAGMPPNVKHVMEYMFPANESLEEIGNVPITDVFDRLAKQFVKAQTFGNEINSCEDFKPFTLYILSLADPDIIVSIGCLLLIIFAFKFATFCIMKSFPYRN